MKPADRARIMADLGLSDPLPVQYLRWLGDIASGSLGKSFFRGDSVAELIRHRGPLSAEIGLLAVLGSWLVGLPVGLISAFRPHRISDNVARSMSVLFIAIPGFWLGMLIVLATLFWFGYKAPLTVVHLWQDPWTNLQLVIGPAIVLGLGQGAYIARMSRSCLLEVIIEDYVRTALTPGSGWPRRLGRRRPSPSKSHRAPPSLGRPGPSRDEIRSRSSAGSSVCSSS